MASTLRDECESDVRGLAAAMTRSASAAMRMNGEAAATSVRQPDEFDGMRESAEKRRPERRERLSSRHAAKPSGSRNKNIQGFAKLMGNCGIVEL